jgi:RecJ-like exonuclease
MGDRGMALEKAKRVLTKYRRRISKYLGWILERPGRMEELGNVYFVDGENFIEERIVGAISSILSASLPHPEKPLLMSSNVEEQNIAKFSARTIEAVVNQGVNLGDVMQVASEACQGEGGGHNIAAGAQVPIEKIRAFVELVDELVGKQLRGEEVGSNYNHEVPREENS